MSSVVREASISTSPLSVDRLLRVVSEPQVGGIGLFVGVVRDRDEGADVTSLDYTGHPSAAAVLRRCADQVAARHDIVCLAVAHRVGHLVVGDLAVVVATGAVHRAEALAACAELIETLKTEVPIWKEQHFESGTTSWVGLSDHSGSEAAKPSEAKSGADSRGADSRDADSTGQR